MFFAGYSALVGDKATTQTGEETIEKLVDQVQNCSLLEDRRAAILGLRGLARDWKLLVGTKGIPVFVKTLVQDKADVEIIKATLDALNVLCTADSIGQSEDLGVMFTEIFTKDPANVSLLLEVLEDSDFYVRFNTVQLLNTLMGNTNALIDGIMASPMGVSRLIDLLDDKREIIRNETLLLLIALTKSNQEIQKIIAFQNAFERLLNIISEEGAADGGIVVQDCLQLIQNMLRYNISNQNLFRETSCIHKMPELFGDISNDPKLWVPQKIENTLSLLELIRILVGTHNPNVSVNQNVLCKYKVLAKLISMAFEYNLPPRIKCATFYTLGDTISGNEKNLQIMLQTTVQPTPKDPKLSAILYMLVVALKNEDFGIRAGAAYLFESFIDGNSDAQIGLAATMLPPPPNNPNDPVEPAESAGSLLMHTILEYKSTRKDPYAVWFASVLLSHVLQGNHQSKTLIINRRVDSENEVDDDELKVSFLHKCIFTVLSAHQQGADVHVILGILCLLAVWLYECPEAVREFLSEGSNIQFLVEQISQTTGVHTLVQGVAAFVLGLCFEFNDNSEVSFTKENIRSLITNRVGVDVFLSRIDRLRESREFNTVIPTFIDLAASKKSGSARSPVAPSASSPDIYFDQAFVTFFKGSYEKITKSITQKRGAAPVQDNQVIQLGRRITELEGIVKSMKAKHAAEVEKAETRLRTVESEHQNLLSAHAALEREQEDLLVCLADQDLLVQELKERLKGFGQAFEEDDDEEEENVM